MWFINKIKENKLPFIMLAIGMLLFTVLFLADRATDTKAEKEEAVIEETQQTAPEAGEYARKIEQKLESVLSCTAGVGKVNVVVSRED